MPNHSVVEPLEERIAPAFATVSLPDAPDRSADAKAIDAGEIILGVGDPLVVTTAADVIDPEDGVLSLREAIRTANEQAGLDNIAFNIPGEGVRTITLSTALPVITDPVVIDGFTQPGASPNTSGPGQGFNSVLLVQLLGAVGNSFDGLTLSAGGSMIRGLVISGFDRSAAILLLGDATDRNVIEYNFIGTNAAGTSAFGNDDGIVLRPGSSDNVIRGNLISGNKGSAITMFGDQSVEFAISGNRIIGNLIGTDKAGVNAIPNDQGLVIFNNAVGNSIGGPSAGDGNVISGNNGDGIVSFGGASGGRPANNNLIEGNHIGVDVAGIAPMSNRGDGIVIFTDAANNVIRGNVISGNQGGGIELLDGAAGTVIRGNRIGTDASGTAAIANIGGGLTIFDANGTLVGGIEAGDGNVISGNSSFGILVNSSNSVSILGNRIGVALSSNSPPVK